MPQPRVFIPELTDYTINGHSEEHMLSHTSEQDKLSVGDHLYCIPWHVCPTVDRHDSVSVVQGKKVTEKWDVVARKRKITW
jgi:D-serine deaminase-like pyridoxal phosphate-dependent protein